jgi:hypothetical protein
MEKRRLYSSINILRGVVPKISRTGRRRSLGGLIAVSYGYPIRLELTLALGHHLCRVGVSPNETCPDGSIPRPWLETHEFFLPYRIVSVTKQLKPRLWATKDSGCACITTVVLIYIDEEEGDDKGRVRLSVMEYTCTAWERWGNACVPVTLPECKPTLIRNAAVSSPMVAIRSLVKFIILLMISRANLAITTA